MWGDITQRGEYIPHFVSLDERKYKILLKNSTSTIDRFSEANKKLKLK